MFTRNTATGAWGRSATHRPRSSHGEHGGTDEMQVENDHSIQVGSRRSRDEYEGTAYSVSMPSVPLNEPLVPLNEPFESFLSASDDDFASSSSGRRGKHHVNELQMKKMDMMDKVQESLQGKIEWTGPKAIEAIERGTPGTPGTFGSDEFAVPEEYYILRDVICPDLFREQVPRNTSALQGDG
ncbi:hypothetical protein Salat_0663100 [Sesamum alatum]|uniref:Uncharacterized protein n=1 Tax=Sesamum alatum TaxID=300844 RepID=A0AAE1YS47_9LAMI|nr:hypothetical protein Salat_0663100 [Sesamum alatum]